MTTLSPGQAYGAAIADALDHQDHIAETDPQPETCEACREEAEEKSFEYYSGA